MPEPGTLSSTFQPPSSARSAGRRRCSLRKDSASSLSPSCRMRHRSSNPASVRVSMSPLFIGMGPGEASASLRLRLRLRNDPLSKRRASRRKSAFSPSPPYFAGVLCAPKLGLNHSLSAGEETGGPAQWLLPGSLVSFRRCSTRSVRWPPGNPPVASSRVVAG